jgi:hypothetical protein
MSNPSERAKKRARAEENRKKRKKTANRDTCQSSGSGKSCPYGSHSIRPKYRNWKPSQYVIECTEYLSKWGILAGLMSSILIPPGLPEDRGPPPQTNFRTHVAEHTPHLSQVPRQELDRHRRKDPENDTPVSPKLQVESIGLLLTSTSTLHQQTLAQKGYAKLFGIQDSVYVTQTDI